MFFGPERGAWQVGTDEVSGRVRFTVWYPPGPDPLVRALHVLVDPEPDPADPARWDSATVLEMEPPTVPHDPGSGSTWTVTTPGALPAGYHEYAYRVAFANGHERRVGDPCARYGGRGSQSSGVVVGGSHGTTVLPLEERLPWRDLVVYELMIDDFTAGYRGGRAPVEAVVDRLDHLVDLGVNAVAFMPWTAWRDPRFDWGYEPCQLFAVEPRYTSGDTPGAEHLSRLKDLVSACHRRGLHVIMDGVFDHVSTEFPYARLYQDQSRCPLVGTFGGRFGGLQDLDFHNPLTATFVDEVCGYWMEELGIDGLRLDAAPWFEDVEHHPDEGLPRVVKGIRAQARRLDLRHFAVVLEYLQRGAAPRAVELGADGYWDDALLEATQAGLDERGVDGRLLTALTPRAALAGTGSAPCAYLGNHDHSQVLGRLGRGDPDQGLGEWWRVQPFVVALFTGTGVPMVPNGQEVGEQHLVPDSDHATRRRILSRPVRWALEDDRVGRVLVALHRRLGRLRREQAALRTPYLVPSSWDETCGDLDPTSGLGFDARRRLVVFHRLVAPGRTDGLVAVVLNFSNDDQDVEVPLPVDGTWTDRLSDFDGGPARTVAAAGGVGTVAVGSHFAAVLTR